MARTLLRKISQYSDEFKATAVGSCGLSGVLIQDVARSLDIHPFMLSRWRNEMREGKIVAKRVNLEPQRKAELKLVHLSPAWADVRALNDQFHAELEALAVGRSRPRATLINF